VKPSKWRRKNALHKVTAKIVKNHGVVVIEDLKVTEMTKTRRGTVEAPGALVQKRPTKAGYCSTCLLG
jgi:putative transposase